MLSIRFNLVAHALLRARVAPLAAAAMLAACGGGGSSVELPPLTGSPAQLDAADEADDTTRARIAQAITAAEGAVRGAVQASGLPLPAAGSQPGAKAWNGLYPGLLQVNLVANTPAYGARLVEPLLQDAWGIAIRPAGFGGHFWLGAAGSGKSIEYVGDVGGTPLFQDGLAVVDTAGPATGVAFNPGAQFTITQDHPNGAITNSA